MAETVEILALLIGIALFAGTASRAVTIKHDPSLGDWLCALYVVLFLAAPFIARAIAPTVKAASWPAFSVFSSLFYVLVGGALGYETGLAEGERRSRL